SDRDWSSDVCSSDLRCFARGRFDSSQRQTSVRITPFANGAMLPIEFARPVSRMIRGGLQILVAMVLGVLVPPLSSEAQPAAKVRSEERRVGKEGRER